MKFQLGTKENPCKSERDIAECIKGKKDCAIYVLKVIGISDLLWKDIVQRNIILKVVRS